MVRRKKKITSFFAATMLSVNILSAIPMVTAHAANPVSSDLLVWYKFDDASGSIAKDSSGHSYNGTLANATAGKALPTWTTGELGGAVNLSGGDASGDGQYITIPNGVLNGLSDITISAFIKRADDKQNEFLVGLGQDSNKYMFITPQNYTPAYRGAITTSSGGSEQVVANNNYIKSTDGWKHVTLTLSATNKTETLYLDGVKVAENTSVTLKPSDLYNATKNFSGYIGKSFYADPYFAGKVDDFRIYDRALSASEVADLASVTDNKQNQASSDALDLAAYNSLTDLTAVKDDLTLPTTVGEGTTVTWSATTSSAITVTTSGAISVAKVTCPTDDDATATLTATISKGTADPVTKTFDVTVTKILTDAETISRDKTALDLGDLSKVTSNLILPTTGANGSTITWSSDNTAVIAANGTVTRPKAANDATVTLTATISKGSANAETKTFTATVTRLVTDTEIITADTAALTLGDTTKVISDLTLPTSGTSGSAITWISSNTSIITADGKVTRPAIGQPDGTATLTATISSGTGTPATKQFSVTVGALKEYDYKLTVDASKTGVNISPDLYGIFFEDINHAADGGLYAELIQNRSFEDSSSLSEWTKVVTGSATGTAALDTVAGDQLNSAQTKALKLTASTIPVGGSVGVSNDGYWGINATKDTEYKLSFFANASTPMDLTASLQSADGTTVYGQTTISNVGTGWNKYTATIKTNSTVADPNAKFVISTSTVGSVLFDVVSLFPPTFNNRENGLRTDLATMVKDMKPKFMRFPGGCFVEGNKLATSFKWKTTVGKMEERAGHSNLWGYRTTDGMGFHEFLQYCEDLGAAPLYVVNIGIAHNDHTTYSSTSTDYLQPYLQDALDAIEYANGDVTTKYGAMRAANGHPAPFNIKYIEIGNENNQGASDTSRSDHYQERFSTFYDAIKAKYPNIQCIGDVVAWGDDNPTWWLNHTTDYMDEHYYRGTQWFVNQANKYDTYNRTGPKVYVGEYAVTDGGDCGLGNLNAAIGEAVYMTGLERNSDIVGMSSYAPLFVNTHDRAWSPDAIVYNSSQAYGTPTYYTQKMFASNVGNVTLPTTLVDSIDKTPVHSASTNVNTEVTGKIGIGSWNTAVTYDNVKVTSNTDSSTLFSDDFSKDASNWITTGGTWNISDGKYVQTNATSQPGRVLTGDAKWTNYTLEMDATKNSGKEGFMIYFGYQNANNFYDLNLGGWNNTVNGIQRIENDKSVLVKSVSGSIETGKTYHIKVVVNGTNVKAYLDDSLVLDYTDANPVQPVDTYRAPLYYVSSRDDAAGEIIIKAVNPNNVAEKTSIDVNGVGNLTSGTISTLTSNSVYDENSFDNPTKVAPVNSTLAGLGSSSSFTYNFAPNSINIIRLKAQNLTPTQTTIGVPTGLTAAPGVDSIGLSWAAVTGATGYNVYKASTADGTYTKINSAPVTTTSYVDSSLTASTTYYYKVTAVNGVVESDKSSSLAATTSTETPTTSSDFTVNSTFNMDNLEANKLLDVQTTVTNNSSSLQSVMAIVALYDPQNAMVNMSYISKNIPMKGTDNLNAGFKLPSDVTGYKVKVFVWDGTDLKSTTMQPLSNVVTK